MTVSEVISNTVLGSPQWPLGMIRIPLYLLPVGIHQPNKHLLHSQSDEQLCQAMRWSQDTECSASSFVVVKFIISCLHTDRAAPKAFFGLAIDSEKSRKGSCGLENTKTSSSKINCSEGQNFVEKKYRAMNMSRKQVEDNQSDRDSSRERVLLKG